MTGINSAVVACAGVENRKRSTYRHLTVGFSIVIDDPTNDGYR
jgi:hypothetical protein